MRPQTPSALADALQVVVDQLRAITEPDGPITVTVMVQARNPADVDRCAVALFGAPAQDEHMGYGKWHRTTALTGKHWHSTGLDVTAFCAIEAPKLALVWPILQPDEVTS